MPCLGSGGGHRSVGASVGAVADWLRGVSGGTTGAPVADVTVPGPATASPSFAVFRLPLKTVKAPTAAAVPTAARPAVITHGRRTTGRRTAWARVRISGSASVGSI